MQKRFLLKSLGRIPSTRTKDEAWVKEEYRINMEVKRGNLVWNPSADRGTGAFEPPIPPSDSQDDI